MTPEVEAAWISAIGGIVAALIAAIAAAYIGQKISKRQKLEADFSRAKADIEFLLEVESAHCEVHRARTGESNKNRVRSDVLGRGRNTWSGRFTPGRNRLNVKVRDRSGSGAPPQNQTS